MTEEVPDALICGTNNMEKYGKIYFLGHYNIKMEDDKKNEFLGTTYYLLRNKGEFSISFNKDGSWRDDGNNTDLAINGCDKSLSEIIALNRSYKFLSGKKKSNTDESS